jgi:hypothetical protein
LVKAVVMHGAMGPSMLPFQYMPKVLGLSGAIARVVSQELSARNVVAPSMVAQQSEAEIRYRKSAMTIIA